MSLWNSYVQPTSVEDALEILTECPGQTAIIAGGTDLLLDMQQGRHPAVDLMLDVTRIEEMGLSTQAEDHIFLGAAVTHAAITSNDLLRKHAACLVEGCGLIGGPQIRNVATIGGNVAHALPAGDGTIALLALDALALIASRAGRIWKPIGELFSGPGETSFDRSHEILVGFRLPLNQQNEGSAFRRVMRPQGVAIAILNMAVWLRLAADHTLEDVHVALGPGGPVPFRAHKTEAFLCGKQPVPDILLEASETLLSEVQLRTSRHRATQAYRQHLSGQLLEGTIRSALTNLQPG